MPASVVSPGTLINKDIAANDLAAGGVTVTEVNGIEVVGARESIVGYVDRETDVFLSKFTGTGDVGLVTVNAE